MNDEIQKLPGNGSNDDFTYISNECQIVLLEKHSTAVIWVSY